MVGTTPPQSATRVAALRARPLPRPRPSSPGWKSPRKNQALTPTFPKRTCIIAGQALLAGVGRPRSICWTSLATRGSSMRRVSPIRVRTRRAVCVKAG
ncbi:MAG: hypothetical protein GTO63_13260, partial [Anaerolineae bacterium]|nr:hypothetical protein [Anaerolineae bacterium]NIN95812.1 hypothetical protein [Anaerolineae bacterium]NIQ78778.1 hypothetical protein [Anaerolineae bacterium]